jgi:hypothetical protein
MSSPLFSSSRWRSAGVMLVVLLGACRPVSAGTALRIELPQEDRDADVFIDGHYVGQVSALGEEPVGPVLLAPGVHRVEVRKPGRFAVHRTVRVDANAPAQTVVAAELLEDPR